MDKPKNLMKLGSVGGVGSIGRSDRKNSPLFLVLLVFSLSFSTDNFFNRTVLTSVVLLKRVAIIQPSQSRELRGQTS